MQHVNSLAVDVQKAADEAAAAAAASAEGAAAEGVKPPKDKDKAIKELIKSIPRERKDVFAYSLKWDAFDANADAILPKLSKWVRIHLTLSLGPSSAYFLPIRCIFSIKPWSHICPASALPRPWHRSPLYTM